MKKLIVGLSLVAVSPLMLLFGRLERGFSAFGGEYIAMCAFIIMGAYLIANSDIKKKK